MGAFDKQITFKLGNSIDDIHGHLARRAGEIDAAKGEAVNTDADLFELSDSCADVDGITAQPVEFSDDQNVTLFPSCRAVWRTLPSARWP